MSKELMLYSRGEMAVPRHDKALAKQAKKIYDATRLEVFQTDAGMAFAKHVMDETVDLHSYREQLAGDDMVLNMMLHNIEAVTIQAATKQLQAFMGNGWNL